MAPAITTQTAPRGIGGIIVGDYLLGISTATSGSQVTVTLDSWLFANAALQSGTTATVTFTSEVTASAGNFEAHAYIIEEEGTTYVVVVCYNSSNSGLNYAAAAAEMEATVYSYNPALNSLTFVRQGIIFSLPAPTTSVSIDAAVQGTATSPPITLSFPNVTNTSDAVPGLHQYASFVSPLTLTMYNSGTVSNLNSSQILADLSGTICGQSFKATFHYNPGSGGEVYGPGPNPLPAGSTAAITTTIHFDVILTIEQVASTSVFLIGVQLGTDDYLDITPTGNLLIDSDTGNVYEYPGWASSSIEGSIALANLVGRDLSVRQLTPNSLGVTETDYTTTVPAGVTSAGDVTLLAAGLLACQYNDSNGNAVVLIGDPSQSVLDNPATSSTYTESDPTDYTTTVAAVMPHGTAAADALVCRQSNANNNEYSTLVSRLTFGQPPVDTEIQTLSTSPLWNGYSFAGYGTSGELLGVSPYSDLAFAVAFPTTAVQWSIGTLSW